MSRIIYFAVLIVAVCGQTASAAGALSAANLRCEYRTDPRGIDVSAPRLSWTLESEQRGQRQTAYQIRVASEPRSLDNGRADLWDSGKVQSDETTAIVYAGKPLTSGLSCVWQVRVWDKDDRPSAWSRPAIWTMGLLAPGDWKAQWIGYDINDTPIPAPAIIQQAQWLWSSPDADKNAPPGAVYFRKAFELPADWIIKRADCFYTGDDFVRLHLNGSLLRSFRNSRTLYDITLADYLKPGRNVLAILAINESDLPTPAGMIAAVRIESECGQVLEFTTDGRWRMSSQEHPDWQTEAFDDSDWPLAQVIGPFGIAPWQQTKPIERILPPARYLRKDFTAHDRPVKRAYIYATALGVYQLFVNGQRVANNEYLSPGWTDYRKRVYYRTYDVTNLLQSGDNALGAILADGWYAGYVGGGLRRNHFGRNLRLMSQLNIEYEDGTTQIIASGPDWKASLGPVEYADLLQGEFYDARKEMPGWNSSGFDDANWHPVIVGGNEVSPVVQAAVAEPVIAFQTLRPVSVSEPVPGNFVFDMGQNFAGVVRLRITGRNGQRITLRHAERLNPDGTIYTTNLRTAAATDTYICKGKGIEIWQPHFTFHGFQYVEVAGLKYKPTLETLTGLAFSSDTPTAGLFECSHPMVNKLYSNAVWTQRMNFIDIPTDCPQRDERYGWTGDAQVYIPTACYLTDVQAFFTKWLIDLADAQRPDGQYPRYAPLRVNHSDGGPAWSDAGVICPWTIYQMYGDTQILRTHYDAMTRYIAFNKNRCTPDLLPPEKFHCFGDWLSINDDTPTDVIFAAYFAQTAKQMAHIADALEKPGDAAMYNELFEGIKAAFNRAYVRPDGKIKGDSQAAYVLAIAYDLLDEPMQKAAADHLVRRIRECNGHLSTGFIGTKDLMLALAKIGRNDIAYQLLYNDTFPSWGFTIKHGATSIWERWNGWTPEEGFADPGMNSFAHYSFGAVCQWMFENIGGISTDGPAFKNILIRPQPDRRMTWANTAYRSIRGPVVSNWRIQNGRFTLEVAIPPNTTAAVFIPGRDAQKILESGAPAGRADGVAFLKQTEDAVVYRVKSGRYQFVSPWTP